MADLRGEPWKKMKRQLTPSFSIPRLKKNVDTINEQAQKVRKETFYSFLIETNHILQLFSMIEQELILFTALFLSRVNQK